MSGDRRGQPRRSQGRRQWRYPLGLCALLGLPLASSGYGEEFVSDQVWTNYILAYPSSERLYYELDLETAHQVSGGDPWHTLYSTGMVEYYPSRLIDLTAELVTGVTYQKTAEESFELSERLGLRIHFLNMVIDSYNTWERFPNKKLGFATLLRFEQRNFWYSGDRPSSHRWRFRNRFELRFALNKPDLATDGVWYLMTDWEWFAPLGGEESAERFATQRRARAGIGYRWLYKWRFELLLQSDHDRDTLDESFELDARVVDLRVKMYL